MKRLLLLGTLLVIGASIVLRLLAIWSLPIIGDEPDDMNILFRDAPGFLDFFSSPRAYAFDQSRLPYLISAPLVFLYQERSIILLRLIFFSFHLFYLFYSYKLIQLLTHNRVAAWLYVLSLVTSCYLASFSIFAMTTSDNLYLFFHIICIYYFLLIYRDQRQTGISTHYLLSILLIALCIASKLFGVLLLISLFVFDSFDKGLKSRIQIRSLHPHRLLIMGLAFSFGILVINLLPGSGVIKLSTALGLSAGYILFVASCVIKEEKGIFPVCQVSFFRFWSSFLLTAFNLTLIFSPVYLNFTNLIKTVTWFHDWGYGSLVARSHYYDMLLIIVMKYGFISCLSFLVALVLSFYVFIKNKLRISTHSPLFLFILVFVIHFTVISLTKHKVTWYPLAIFPFLYLPFVWLYHLATKHQWKRLAVAVSLCFALVLIDNAARYIRWFPYGHFDGAQYGREYIGWNRAGFISYEIVPHLYNYMISLRNYSETEVHCQVIGVPRYNRWVAQLLNRHFQRQGAITIRFRTSRYSRSLRDRYDYFLTSPIYYPEFEQQLKNAGLTRIKTLGLKGIDIVSIWGMAES